MIDLTNQEAQSFKVFRENQDVFEFMQESGVFDVNTGSVTLHFNNRTLSKIDATEVIFRRKLAGNGR